jgi:ComF family protein
MLELIYPSVCGICEKIDKEYLCEECKEKLKKYCINEIEDCKENKRVYYDYKIKILRYENIVREKIIEYKFNEKTYLYNTMEKIILNDEKICSFLKKYDIIIPVPMYKKRKQSRGYNQTELISKKLAKDLKIESSNKVLRKVIDTKKQSTLTKKERIKNVENAFNVVNSKSIENKNVILLDDIFTTGSTLNECSRMLKLAGTKEIAILTIAVD